MITNEFAQSSLSNQNQNIIGSQNKAYLAFAYARDNSYTSQNETQYYNAQDKKTKKKKKVKKFAIAGALALSTVAIVGTVFKGKGGDITKLLKENIKDLNIKDLNLKDINIKDINIKDSKIFNTIGNLWSNLNNIKDDLWDRYVAKKTKNIPILKGIDKFGQWITEVYRKGAKSCFQADYTKAYNELIEQAQKENITLYIENYDELFDSLNKGILKTLQENRVAKGILKGENIIEKANNLVSQVAESNIADGKIIKLDSVQKLMQDIEFDEEVGEKLAQSLEKFNNVRRKTASALIPKLRDINAGSAPTDMLTILLSSLGLVTTVALTDDKQEKKSIVTNIGIPLMGTLGCNIIMTLKCITGAPAMIFSLAMGQVAKAGAKLLTKASINNIEVD